jgi:hypothetical protein
MSSTGDAGYPALLSFPDVHLGVLAAGLIRDDLRAHLALAPVGEQPPSSTPASLPVRTISGTELEPGNETPDFPGEEQAALSGC